MAENSHSKDRKGLKQGPLGDVIPVNPDEAEPHIPGGKPPEDVEDRPNVSTVTPEDYPEKGKP